MLTADYNKYMDAHQAVNFYLHEAFEEQGIEFAYPTQTLFIENHNMKDKPQPAE